MAKELPYFRFYPEQWLSGTITLESLEVQGAFMNICAIYWASECNILSHKFKKRFGDNYDQLLISEIIKEIDGFAVISFLDEQWIQLSKLSDINRDNGKKKRNGSETAANYERNGSENSASIKDIKEKKEVKDIKESILPASILESQINSLYPNPNDYEKTEIDKFISYWTEPNKSGTRLRYQLEKTWDTQRRINTWFANAEKFNPKSKTMTDEEFLSKI